MAAAVRWLHIKTGHCCLTLLCSSLFSFTHLSSSTRPRQEESFSLSCTDLRSQTEPGYEIQPQVWEAGSRQLKGQARGRGMAEVPTEHQQEQGLRGELSACAGPGSAPCCSFGILEHRRAERCSWGQRVPRGWGLLPASTGTDTRCETFSKPCQHCLGHPRGVTNLCSASAAAGPPSGAWSCPGPPRAGSTSH